MVKFSLEIRLGATVCWNSFPVRVVRKEKKNLLGVRALLFYENDCKGKWKTIKWSSFRKGLPLQTHLPEIITMIGNCHQDSHQPGILLTSLLLPVSVAGFWVRIDNLIPMFYFQFNIEHNISLFFFRLKSSWTFLRMCFLFSELMALHQSSYFYKSNT